MVILSFLFSLYAHIASSNIGRFSFWVPSFVRLSFELALIRFFSHSSYEKYFFVVFCVILVFTCHRGGGGKNADIDTSGYL
jgi:hypothetical protein